MTTIVQTLRLVSILLALAILGLGANVLATELMATWTTISLTGSIVIFAVSMIVAIVWKGQYFAQLIGLYATVLIGRLFGTIHIGDSAAQALSSSDVLLVAETGPGQPTIIALAFALAAAFSAQLIIIAYQDIKRATGERDQRNSLNDWALTFIRAYIGLMFIAHYSGHVLAGPVQFKIFAGYFSGVGFGIGAPMVILAGLIEIAISTGLTFGFMTRIAAIGAALYLFLSTLWGAHFGVGYVWVLPTGGWEFPIFWMFIVSMFAAIGGGQISIDRMLRERFLTLPKYLKWAIA